LGDCVLHCWGRIPFRNVRQPHLFSDSRRRKLPFPLAELLGHHGVYFAPLMFHVRLGSLTDITCAGQGCPLFSWNQTLRNRLNVCCDFERVFKCAVHQTVVSVTTDPGHDASDMDHL
jgi:hypothetical protein